MILSDLSIRKPVFAWMIMLSLLLFGAISFSRLGVSQNPDIDFPVLNVALTWEGAAPEVIENEVVDPIEEAMMTIDGIKKVTSTSRLGAASVTAEFVLSKNIDTAVQEVQTKIAQAQRFLPKDMDPPIIQKFNPEDQPILWIGVSGTKPYLELVHYVRDTLKDKFQTLPGVGEVFLGGFVEPNLRVWLDPKKMAALQLTVDDVIGGIQQQHTETPAGLLQTFRQERSVRVMGETTTPEELENITIPQRIGQGLLWRKVRLSDVARVEEGLADVRRLSRIRGETALGLGIKKQRGANAVDVARAVKQRMREVDKDLPPGVKLGINFNSTQYIEENIHELIVTLGLSVLLTSLVCWLFLGSLSSTVNVFLAIPTALGGTLTVIYFLGFTLNTISLMAISLVIGIVVDDAIVVLENIVRHREQGESQVAAAVLGAREITFSVLVISSAVIAIFLPVAFMKGLIGKFFFQFGVTISIAVAFSMLEALTLAPMRCSQFLSVGHTSWLARGMERALGGLQRAYRGSLAVSLRFRWGVILLSVLFFLGTLQGLGLLQGVPLFKSLPTLTKLKVEQSPPQDQSVFLVQFQTPPGSSLSWTNEVFKKAEEFMLARPEVLTYFGAIGGFGGGEVNSGILFVTMKPKSDRPRQPSTRRAITQQEFMQLARENLGKISGMSRVAILDLSQSFGGGAGSRGFPIELSLRGPEWDRLGELAETFRERLLKTGLAVDVDTSYRVGVPEVRVLPDRVKAAASGVTVASIARAINATVGGVRVGKYTKGGRRYDIRVSLAENHRQSIADIRQVFVRNLRGEMIPLSEVITILEKPALLTIQRENRERAVSVFGNVAPGQSQAKALEAAQQIAREILPEGYHLVLAGGAEQFFESMIQLGLALGLGIVIAYMILGAQFNSFVHPFTVLLALPFSAVGAFLALWATHQSINIMSMIGIILLMGIVKKNSILLVDFTNARRLAGLTVHEALLEACPLRLRPILMTSLAIVAGALPSALSLGPGAEVRMPMSVTIIGGTLLSTLLTLYVVPCAYSLFSFFDPPANLARQKELDQLTGEGPTSQIRS